MTTQHGSVPHMCIPKTDKSIVGMFLGQVPMSLELLTFNITRRCAAYSTDPFKSRRQGSDPINLPCNNSWVNDVCGTGRFCISHCTFCAGLYGMRTRPVFETLCQVLWLSSRCFMIGRYIRERQHIVSDPSSITLPDNLMCESVTLRHLTH